MTNQSTQFSTLSSSAKQKGRLLYYSLILQNINIIHMALSSKSSGGKLPIFYILISTIGAFSLYWFRPSNVQSLINKWSNKNQFPIKNGSLKHLRFYISLGFIVSLLKIFSSPDSIEIHSVLMVLLGIPMLIFIFDKEITEFIYDNQRQDSKSKIPLLMVVCILTILAFGYKAYQRSSSADQVQRINKCLESGGCMDPKTLACGPYVKDATKMCGLPRSGH